MSETVDVAIDAGQTGVRVGVVRRGRLVARRDGPGLTYGAESGSAAALDGLTGPWRAVAPDATVGSVCVGLTSVLGGDAGYRALADGLLDRLAAHRVLLGGDVVTAHAGALGMCPGVVLAAGTGAIALGLSADGRCHTVDGGGYLYGDAGGGFWVGRRGLDAALRGYDGRTEPGPLTRRATEVFGDLGRLPERLYPADDRVAQVAGFARHVLELSDSDPVAAAIVDTAAAELAATTAAAGGDDVSWTGRLLQHDGLRERFAAALHARRPSARLHPPAGDGLDGAAALAASTDLGPYVGLLRVVTR
ncbi:BadF/BadG/BcrA/BcrD ATPase family protein [Actinocatenispora thailandica]|uniref:BadF/BadG/BcrA/BcrD ATPase family protein n=1 Tax=Actinocatenispora thailandica TaxID=227318 RepID=UPI001951D664|nr:BadF/BadG/BcrA/BcrD ATPase family protein [Actinocatenispora thailandica]